MAAGVGLQVPPRPLPASVFVSHSLALRALARSAVLRLRPRGRKGCGWIEVWPGLFCSAFSAFPGTGSGECVQATHGHSTSHSHSHGHSHSHSHNHDHGQGNGRALSAPAKTQLGACSPGHARPHDPAAPGGVLHAPPAPRRNMNEHGVFLHVLGDALGSVGVIASALVMKSVPLCATKHACLCVGCSRP